MDATTSAGADVSAGGAVGSTAVTENICRDSRVSIIRVITFLPCEMTGLYDAGTAAFHCPEQGQADARVTGI